MGTQKAGRARKDVLLASKAGICRGWEPFHLSFLVAQF